MKIWSVDDNYFYRYVRFKPTNPTRETFSRLPRRSVTVAVIVRPSRYRHRFSSCYCFEQYRRLSLNRARPVNNQCATTSSYTPSSTDSMATVTKPVTPRRSIVAVAVVADDISYVHIAGVSTIRSPPSAKRRI